MRVINLGFAGGLNGN